MIDEASSENTQEKEDSLKEVEYSEDAVYSTTTEGEEMVNENLSEMKLLDDDQGSRDRKEDNNLIQNKENYNALNNNGVDTSVPNPDSQNEMNLEDSAIEDEDTSGELSELSMDTNTNVDGIGHTSIIKSNIFYGKNEEEDDDTTYPCPMCQTEIDASKYGKIECPNPSCGFTIYRRNPHH